MTQNESKQKNTGFKWVILPTLITFGIQIFVTFFLVEIFAIVLMGKYAGATYGDFMNQLFGVISQDTFNLVFYIVYGSATISVMILIYKKLFAAEPEARWIQNKFGNIAFTIIGMVLFAIAFQYICQYVFIAVAGFFPEWAEEYNVLIEQSGIGVENTPVALLYSVFIAPIVEEIVFRGVTLTAARKIMPVNAAIIVQAVMFGLFHMNPMQGIFVAILGVGLGYVMYLYDNIVIVIILHILFNFIGSCLVNYLPFDSSSVYMLFAYVLGSLIVAYIAFICLRKGVAVVKNDTDVDDI
ncbi:CPBP family glutamic-type intramembrane protease [Pseudobutyrivibrio sp.]|uniref:CPBP family glutamic-type intramembrane protease n=1 Tax=Pseudobutyrivibrio sp. TaxID=2014367 RepID=UPI0025EC0FE1|nr:type II CAAX endopeptidase family protein [Pseudobutyrivibrio sp.]